MVVNQHLLGEQEGTDLESGIIRIEHASQQNADKTNTQHHISRRGHFFQTQHKVYNSSSVYNGFHLSIIQQTIRTHGHIYESHLVRIDNVIN